MVTSFVAPLSWYPVRNLGVSFSFISFLGGSLLLGILLLTYVSGVSCNQMSCLNGQTCVQEGGDGRCVPVFTIPYKGKPLSVPAESCLPTKPHFIDAQGNIIFNRCQGRDGLIGTRDDCGCAFGNQCQTNGRCAPVCNDGTAAGQCSRDQPYACSAQGELIPNATECGCPASAPILLPSGLCSPGLSSSFSLARDFLGGNYTSLELTQRAFPALLPTIQTSGFACGSALLAGKHVLGDGRSELTVATANGNYPYYRGTCTLASRAQNPSVTLDFGAPVTIDSLQLAVSMAPSILEYQLDYFDALHDQWKPFYTGQISSVLTPELKGPRHHDFSGDAQYRQTDTGYITEYYYWPNVKGGALFAQEAIYGGIPYTMYREDVAFSPVTSSKLRLRPTSWQQDAGIYEITVYNTSRTSLQLTKRSGGDGILQHASSGVYTSPALYLPASTSSLTYGAFTWNTDSTGLNVEGRGTMTLPPRMVVYDALAGVPWGNDIEYFGDPNTPNISYRTPITGSYPEAGFSSVRYDKTCMYDGKFAKDYTPGTACLGHPAVLTRLWSPYWNEITNPEIYSMHLFYDYYGGQTFDRFILEEAIDRIARIRIKDLIGGSYTTVLDYRKTPTGAPNITTVLPIPGGNHRALYVDMWIALHPGEVYWSGPRYTMDIPYRHGAYPLVWEAGFYQSIAPVMRPARPATDYPVRFQFRSAQTQEALLNASWYGANGVLDGMFSASGQQIGAVHTGNPWYQYRVLASTPDTRDSPLITNISVAYTGVQQLPPVGVIAASDDHGLVGAVFNFSGQESYDLDGQVVSYAWTFGDGTSASGSATSHSYTQPGTYFVELVVTDNQGATSRSLVDVVVAPFDCLTPEAPGTSDNGLYAIADPVTQELARQALLSYANARGLRVSDLDSADQRFEAVSEYLYTHMSYLAHDSCEALRSAAGADATLSVPELVQTGGSCSCPDGALYCGMCRDFMTAFTTLARAAGINSKCVYSAVTAPVNGSSGGLHGYNIIVYNGAYRIVDPQRPSWDATFSSGILSWTNKDNVPYYLTGTVFNDQVGSFGDYATRSLQANNAFAQSRVDNYQGPSGLPETSVQCAPRTVSIASSFRSQVGGWDPARLFTDVCA